jgi:hypothetical protein
MAEWLPSMLPLLGLTLVLGHLDRGNPNTRLILIYILISGLWGGFIAGGAGVDRNALFDLLIGLTIASAVTIDRLGRGTTSAFPYGALLRAAALLMLVAIVLAPAPGRLLKARTFLAELADREAQAEADLAFLAGHPGSVACEVLALCYWAGKGFEIDFYGTGQKLRTGMIPRSALAKRLEHREFDVIQLQNKRHFRLTKEIHAVLLRHYSVERFSDINGFFFVPMVDQPDVAPSIR